MQIFVARIVSIKLCYSDLGHEYMYMCPTPLNNKIFMFVAQNGVEVSTSKSECRGSHTGSKVK